MHYPDYLFLIGPIDDHKYNIDKCKKKDEVTVLVWALCSRIS